MHVKDVTVANIKAIDDMDCNDDEVAARWLVARRWITDPSAYDELPPITFDDLLHARLKPGDLANMEKRGLCRKLEAEEVPRGTVDLYTLAEVSKRRRRRIGHTVSINGKYGKDRLQQMRQPTRRQQLRQALFGSHSVSLDFAACYDAYELPTGIQLCCCFRVGRDVWCLTRLPMGQRQACEVAQSATDKLLAFDKPKCEAQSLIDNVRFVGSPDDIVAAALTFVARCNEANIRINDIDQRAPNIEAQLRAIVKQRDTWLGIEYDLQRKEVCVGTKSIEKLKAARIRATMAAYDVASLFGLLIFCSGVLNTNIADRFRAMRFLRVFSLDVFEDPSRWRQNVAIPEWVLADIRAWIADVKRNRPVSIAPDDAHMTIVVDSSVWGWGAIALDSATGAVQQASQPWTADDRRAYAVAHSVYAEPLGAFKALCRFVRPLSAAREHVVIDVLTDSTTAVSSLNAGYSPSFVVNAIVGRVRRSFPGVTVRATHIPGRENLADALSRGQTDKVELGDEPFGGLRGGRSRFFPPNTLHETHGNEDTALPADMVMFGALPPYHPRSHHKWPTNTWSLPYGDTTITHPPPPYGYGPLWWA